MARKGMLHQLTYQIGTSVDPIENNHYVLFDLSRDLTLKMQNMVRQGQIFKLVGIDVGLENNPDTAAGSVSGSFHYYTPTKGRCDAWRKAFSAVMKWRKIQGISPNFNYDFRVGIDAALDYENYGGTHYGSIANQAWIELDAESDPLGLYLEDSGTVESKQSIFDVWNIGIPINTATPDFGQGWHPYLPVSGDNSEEMDFVKHEFALLKTNPRGPQQARAEFDEIPFMVAYTQGYPTGYVDATNFKWRPTAGEYLPIMNGLLYGHMKDVSNFDDEATVEITVSFHISGWYPILKRRKFKGKRRSGKSKRSRRK